MTDLWHYGPLVPFSETLSFKTDIQQAYDAQSRVSNRLARSVYAMRHRVDDTVNLDMEGLFDDRRLTTMRVPAWGEATEFAVALWSGATVLPVGPADWRAGGEVLLLGPAKQREVATVASVAPGALTLTAPATIPVKMAMPLRTCRALSDLTGTRMFPGLSERQVSFVTQDNLDLGAHDMVEIDGLPVLDDAFEIAAGVEQAMMHPVQIIDEGQGGIDTVPLRAGVDHKLGIVFTDVGPAAMFRRRQWWHFLCGQAGEFWLPSFADGLRLVSTLGASSLTMTIAARGWSPSLLTGRVVGFDDGGGRIYRKATGVTPSGGNWVVDLSAAPGRAIPTSARLSIVRRMRLDSDDIPLGFPMQGMMRSGAVCVGVP